MKPRQRSGWRKVKEAVCGHTCGAWWQSHGGHMVQHCGHPTALRPYLIITPDGTPVLDGTSQVFPKLIHAQRAVEMIEAGRVNIVSTDHPAYKQIDRLAIDL